MNYWPFRDPEVANRFADGLLKAGLPGEPSGYYKVSEEDKLTGEEIRALLFGRTVSGFLPETGEEWWVKVAKDGKTTLSGDPSDSGTTWIEGDMVWRQLQKGLFGRKTCYTLFRNPEGTPEMKNEYLWFGDLNAGGFSPVD